MQVGTVVLAAPLGEGTEVTRGVHDTTVQLDYCTNLCLLCIAAALGQDSCCMSHKTAWVGGTAEVDPLVVGNYLRLRMAT